MELAQEHKHSWRGTMNLDGCHWYSNSYTCDCGATATSSGERNPTADPYSFVWMEPRYEEIRRDERGRFIKPRVEEVKCDRCEELRNGAPVKRDLVIVAKDGTIEREEHKEINQQEEADE